MAPRDGSQEGSSTPDKTTVEKEKEREKEKEKEKGMATINTLRCAKSIFLYLMPLQV